MEYFGDDHLGFVLDDHLLRFDGENLSLIENCCDPQKLLWPLKCWSSWLKCPQHARFFPTKNVSLPRIVAPPKVRAQTTRSFKTHIRNSIAIVKNRAKTCIIVNTSTMLSSFKWHGWSFIIHVIWMMSTWLRCLLWCKSYPYFALSSTSSMHFTNCHCFYIFSWI